MQEHYQAGKALKWSDDGSIEFSCDQKLKEDKITRRELLEESFGSSHLSSSECAGISEEGTSLKESFISDSSSESD